MRYDTVVVRYGEIFLKSEYVRRKFFKRLAENVRSKLNRQGVDYELALSRHNILIGTGEAEKVAQLCARVFGVSSASYVLKVEKDHGKITDAVLALASEVLEDLSFCVRVKRTKDFPMTSMELEKDLGAKILEIRDNKVDLSKPQKTIHVDMIADSAYVYSERIPGVGGMPYGTQGTLAAQVLDEKDALAAFMLMRRGCKIAAIGDKEFIDRLQEYANPRIKVYASMEELLGSERPLGVVTSAGLNQLSELPKTELPYLTPLIGLSQNQFGNMMALSGL